MENLPDDVLDLIGKSSLSRPEFWRQTVVMFVGEEGIDQGGLTVEMHSQFWSEVVKSQLFDVSDGAALPTKRAAVGPDVFRREVVGRMLCKSILDDHPIGGGLGGFVFEFLIDVHEQRAFRSPRAA